MQQPARGLTTSFDAASGIAGAPTVSPSSAAHGLSPRSGVGARSGPRAFPLPLPAARRFPFAGQLSLPAVTATTTITILAIVALAMPGAGTTSTSLDPTGSHASLRAGAALLAVMTGTVLIAYARYGDHIAAAWLGGAFILFGLLPLGLDAAATSMPSLASNEPAAWLQLGGRTAVLAVLLVTLFTSRSPETWRRRPTRIASLTVTITAVSVLIVAVAPEMIAGLAAGPFDATVAQVTAGFHLSVAWLVVAALFASAGIRRNDQLLGWVALAAIAFSAAEAGHVVAWHQGMHSHLAAEALQVSGLAVLLVGAIRGLALSVQEQRLHLLRRAVHAEAQADDSTRRQRVQVHEARNALSGVVNTLRYLDDQRVSLDDDTQRDLLAASFTELLRLQQLFTPEEYSAADYRIVDALGSVLAASRAAGLDVQVDLPSDLSAHGSWLATAQAVQNLLENARRYAAGSPSPVSVTGRRLGTNIELAIVDHGPGVAGDERDDVFERGVRGVASRGTTGSGLGLSITRELMQREGGTVRVEPTPGGGATFVISIPAARPTSRETDANTSSSAAHHA